MPRASLSRSEIEEVLRRTQLVRVAFVAEVPYVITLGFTYYEGCLVGVTAPGRKSELVEQDSRVGFQVDTSIRDGLYEWASVHGEGRFTINEPEPDVLAAVAAALPDPPPWFVSDQTARFEAGVARTFRIEPTVLHGVRSGA